MSETRRRFRLLPADPEIGWTPWAWLVYLAPFIVSPLAERDVTGTMITLAATILFLAIYFRAFWSSGRTLLLLVAAMTLIGCLFLPTNGGAAVFFIYAGSFAPWIDRRVRTTVVVVAIVCCVLIAEALLFELHPLRWSWGVVFAILVAGLNYHSVQTRRMNARLRLAQGEVERLAKLAERERIARDLHDVVGHTLSVIVLKSELASRIAEIDPLRAREEIRDVERVSRQALEQVRTAISGYRSEGLGQEIENAKKVLAAGAVDLVVSRSEVALSPKEEAVVSLALRECVTNVIRHAGARNCAVVIDQDESGRRRVVVEDDGGGSGAPEGMGIRGMRERLAMVGGTLAVEGGRGTRVLIELPPLTTAEPAS